MVRDDLHITVPSFFRCPISLDLMKSPVSLCTGVTYDRSSIQRWLDDGNNTCPATMQVLQTKEFVPNHTLQRLIQIWSDSVRAGSDSAQLTEDQALALANQIKKNVNSDDQNRNLRHISELIEFATEATENRRLLATVDGLVPLLIEITSNQSRKNLVLAEKTVQLCDLVLTEYKGKEELAKLAMDKDWLRAMIIVLQRGILESRIATARVLEVISVNAETKIDIAEGAEVLPELLKLASPELGPNAVEAGLSVLLSLSQPRRIRGKLVRLGSVMAFSKMLSNPDLSVSATEKLLKLLETVLSSKEGRAEVCKDEHCVAAVVRKLMKVSTAATEHAVTILWSLCCLFRDPKAQEAVRDSNGLCKVLLIMQSNCSPAVRQMSGDLIKIFRVTSKSCLSSYDTKTTHIMPF